MILGMAMRADSTRLGPTRIRLAQRGLARLAPHTLCGLKTLARPAYSLARRPAGRPTFFFLIFMIKLSMFKNWETLRSSQNYVKTLGN